jgi:hypothetical protein
VDTGFPWPQATDLRLAIVTGAGHEEAAELIWQSWQALAKAPQCHLGPRFQRQYRAEHSSLSSRFVRSPPVAIQKPDRRKQAKIHPHLFEAILLGLTQLLKRRKHRLCQQMAALEK